MTGEVPAPAWSVCSPGRGPEIRPCYLMRPAGRLAARTVPIGKARCLGGGLASTIGTFGGGGDSVTVRGSPRQTGTVNTIPTIRKLAGIRCRLKCKTAAYSDYTLPLGFLYLGGTSTGLPASRSKRGSERTRGLGSADFTQHVPNGAVRRRTCTDHDDQDEHD